MGCAVGRNGLGTRGRGRGRLCYLLALAGLAIRHFMLLEVGINHEVVPLVTALLLAVQLVSARVFSTWSHGLEVLAAGATFATGLCPLSPFYGRCFGTSGAETQF